MAFGGANDLDCAYISLIRDACLFVLAAMIEKRGGAIAMTSPGVLERHLSACFFKNTFAIELISAATADFKK